MRTAMPNEESVLTLMGSVAMEHKAFDRLSACATTAQAESPVQENGEKVLNLGYENQ